MFNIHRFFILLVINITYGVACNNMPEDTTNKSYQIASQVTQQNSQNLVDHEDCESQYQLANYLTEQMKYKKAITFYTKAAHQNHVLSQSQLGYFYANGFGVRKDISKAIEWYTQAAQHNNVEAQFNLGILYSSINNYDLARKWYNIAAKNNHPEAQFIINNF